MNAPASRGVSGLQFNFFDAAAPTGAGFEDDPDGDADSVGDATGLAGAWVGVAVGVTGSGEDVGPADADDDIGDGEVTSSRHTAGQATARRL